MNLTLPFGLLCAVYPHKPAYLGQRYEYDWDLVELEEDFEQERLLYEEEKKLLEKERRQQDEEDLYASLRNGATNLKKSLNSVDPWDVFDQFFFRGDESKGTGDASESRGHRPPAGSRDRTRVSETTIDRGYDPSFGSNIYTVLRREEHIDDRNHNGETYYQVLGQDFVSGKRHDQYTGFVVQQYYAAVSDVYLVEEGYSIDENSIHDHDDLDYNQSPPSSHQQSMRNSKTRVEEGEKIFPNLSSDPWVSPNKKYEAVLTTSCELQIIRHGDKDSGDNATPILVWSSETYIPVSRAHGCHLSMSSTGRLALSVDYDNGLLDSVGNAVLWNSPEPPVVPTLGTDTVMSKYYASLDDDGALSIYRIRMRKGERHKRDQSKQERNVGVVSMHFQPLIEKIGSVYNRMSIMSVEQGQTKATLAWNQLRYSVGKLFTQRAWAASSSPEDSINSRHECVYSTGVSGCFSPGRNAVHLSRYLAHSVKQTLEKSSSHLGKFLTSLAEPAVAEDDSFEFGFGYSDMFSDDEEDQDILDTLLRVTGAGANKVGRAGANIAKMGMKKGHKVMVEMKNKMGNQK